MEKVKNNLKEYLMNLHENVPVSLIELFNESKKLDLNHKDLFPCFFTGNLLKKNSIVTISLNPKIDKSGIDKKREEQGPNFDEWIESCIYGFEGYKGDIKKLHLVWKNLFKALSGSLSNNGYEIVDFLQKNVINLDWCYYYSSKFLTLSEKELKFSKRRELYEIFDNNLESLITHIEPKIIFIHGKSFQSWIVENVTKLKLENKLFHGEKSYKLFSGFYRNTKIPVVYQEWFINSGNANVNLLKVNHLLNMIINGIER